jgi:hypothetical protein
MQNPSPAHAPAVLPTGKETPHPPDRKLFFVDRVKDIKKPGTTFLLSSIKLNEIRRLYFQFASFTVATFFIQSTICRNFLLHTVACKPGAR